MTLVDTRVESAWCRRLKLKYDEPVSDCAFNFNLRRYIMVWDAKDGKVVRQLKGHAHWVNTLALSSEYAIRTGPYDHKAVKPENDEEAKASALKRYEAGACTRSPQSST